MSKEKQIENGEVLYGGTRRGGQQIEEMSLNIQDAVGGCSSYWSRTIAERLFGLGYRKQSEGEWIDANPNGAVYKFACTLCGETKLGKGTPYCPNCGAKMKGGEE